jgi:hypothetical protein
MKEKKSVRKIEILSDSKTEFTPDRTELIYPEMIFYFSEKLSRMFLLVSTTLFGIEFYHVEYCIFADFTKWFFTLGEHNAVDHRAV